MQAARVVAWHAAPGARLQPGDALCDVATATLLERDGGSASEEETVLVVELHEEATLAVVLEPASADGARLLAVGAPLALLCEDEGDAAALAKFVAARGYAGGDSSAAVAPLWQAYLSAAAAPGAPRGCH